MSTHKEDRKLFGTSLLISLTFCVLVAIIYFFQLQFASRLVDWGIYPRTIEGLRGIIFAPLLHGSIDHLTNNLWSFFILLALAIYSYRNVAYISLLWIWLTHGVGVWIIGRENYHIGISGIIYGLGGFLLVSGLLRNNNSLRAISIIVVLFHTGFLYGMSPQNFTISWEGHLCGFIGGVFCSIFYLHEGPEDDKHPEWMLKEEEEPETGNEYWREGAEDEKRKENEFPLQFKYDFVEKKKEGDEK